MDLVHLAAATSHALFVTALYSMLERAPAAATLGSYAREFTVAQLASIGSTLFDSFLGQTLYYAHVLSRQRYRSYKSSNSATRIVHSNGNDSADVSGKQALDRWKGNFRNASRLESTAGYPKWNACYLRSTSYLIDSTGSHLTATRLWFMSRSQTLRRLKRKGYYLPC